MAPTRREFIKQFGVTLASLFAARCTFVSSPPADPTPTLDLIMEEDDPLRHQLRSCWYRLEHLAKLTQEDSLQGEKERDNLIDEHRFTLDSLITMEQLEPAIADQLQDAFAAAAYITWDDNANITIMCYITLKREATASCGSGREDLVDQVTILIEIAESDSFDPDTVALALSAIEQDLAFCEAVDELNAQGLGKGVWGEQRVEKAERRLHEQSIAGELEASPEAVAAARFLVELLLEKPE